MSVIAIINSFYVNIKHTIKLSETDEVGILIEILCLWILDEYLNC